MNRISNIQLFTLIMIFEIGSTTLFALGIGAKQDAWIVIITASLVGFFYCGYIHKFLNIILIKTFM